ncbi:MAG: glycosyltransferase [Bacteroidetes bacterium]|nr:MAG: glycosyltransferase [Bacteroidota bacterium]
MLANLTFSFWLLINVLLLVHVVHEMVLLVHALFHRKKPNPLPAAAPLPFVTVQLPLYNEKYVVERLLEAVSRLDYPRDRLEVQILDDSTDETSDLIRQFLVRPEHRATGFRHIRRPDRSGYKAGALDYGLKHARGEFIAIFDADFVPDPHFLQIALAPFRDPETGMVQTRWLHINERASILTRAQAILLNTHFSIEHLGRTHAQVFINFNGTAGIWRRRCIEAAGGWQADTLTEDLDLSFRAQMTGWKFEYLFDVGSPAELPVTFDAFRTQQFRWAKGGAECFRKNIGALWRSAATFRAKTLGSLHLLSSSVYLLVVGLLFLSPAVYYFQKTHAISGSVADLVSVIGPAVLVSLLFIFYVGDTLVSRNKWRSTLLFLPSMFVLFSITTGISLYMAFGVLEGYLGKRSPFVRTPKFGIAGNLPDRVKRGYNFKKEYSIRSLEVLALSYGCFWLMVSFYNFNLMTCSYGLMILFGFSLAVFFKERTF